MNFKIPNLIFRYRVWWIVGFLAVTLYFGFQALKTSLSYELARVLPPDDEDFLAYTSFKELYGEDGNIMVIGFKSDSLFFNDILSGWDKLEQDIKTIAGISGTMSINSAVKPSFDKQEGKISILPLYKLDSLAFNGDSIRSLVGKSKFYHGLIYNPKSNATLMVVSFSKELLNSPKRIETVKLIKSMAQQFEEKQSIKLHYSGMPYVRTEYMQLVSKEMKLFMVLALIVTSLVILAFFRSLSITFFSILILGVEVIWCLGTMNLLGYKVSILSGMIPALIIVISIPNSIFLINRYYQELSIHKNKGRALIRTIQRVWFSLLLANLTTAIGFGVFYYTKSIMLVEFGIVAALNVMLTFVITMVLVPIMLSFLPVPSQKRSSHLQAVRTGQFLAFINNIVLNHRKSIYVVITILTVISIYGMSKAKIIGRVVDDLPSDHPIYSDLKFFENEFGGVLPLEIVIDSKKENGLLAEGGKVFYKIHSFERELRNYKELSNPLSLSEAIKFINQEYKGGEIKYYSMPSPQDLAKYSTYFKGLNSSSGIFSTFIDSTRRFTRISYRMNDVGSVRMKELVDSIRPQLKEAFPEPTYKSSVTGLSLVYLKNNDYLLKNLFESLIIEIILIALIGMVLFKSIRIILLSKLPCIIPLIITSGIMGFAGIEFKATTILVFTIAFGLASDGTIYFLTRFRHELRSNNRSIEESVSITIKETGLSMIYTAVVLFFGFAIFAASSFGGTKALGLLVSTTLLVSMITNLILMPAILLSLKKHIVKQVKTAEESWIDEIED